MKPYQQVPIEECLEPLVKIPEKIFGRELPHPYEKLGAPYEGLSPYYLRAGVLEALLQAQKELQKTHPGWRLKIFDAFRPVSVQQFMVDYTFVQLSDQGIEDAWSKVYQFWAKPSYDAKTPPPHSTGAAIDLTLENNQGESLFLGSVIDEVSDRSLPDYYAQSTTEQERMYHKYRNLLNQVMKKSGFYRHPGEWWHFSLGDQMWAWQHNINHPEDWRCAHYGRVI